MDVMKLPFASGAKFELIRNNLFLGELYVHGEIKFEERGQEQNEKDPELSGSPE